MTVYDLETNSTEHINDQFIMKKQMKPMWLFTDIYGAHVNREGKFWCFIGGHFPDGLMSENKDEYNRAVGLIITGKWQEAWQKDENVAKGNMKVGYGFGDNPNQAFKRAVVCAGYLKGLSKGQDHVLKPDEGCD